MFRVRVGRCFGGVDGAGSGVSGVWGRVRVGCVRFGPPVGGWLDGLEVLVDAGYEGCGGPGLWDAYDSLSGVVYELGGGVP